MSTDSDGKLIADIPPLADRPEVYQTIETLIIFSCLVFVWSCLRIYSSRLRTASMMTEDILYYMSVFAYYIVVAACFTGIYFGGSGHHLNELRELHIARFTPSILVFQGMYGVSMCASKWSILWMVKRIFQVRWFWFATWTIIIIQACWALITVLISVLICRPIQKGWDPTVEGECADQVAAYTAVSGISVIIDVMMCISPLPMIWSLQVKKAYRVALLGIFSVGAVSVVFSILRLFSVRSLDSADIPYTGVRVITWTVAENGVIILVASAPLLRPVFDATIGKCLPTERNKASRKSSDPETDNSHSASTVQSKARHQHRERLRNRGESEESLELGDMTARMHVEAIRQPGNEFGMTSQESGRGIQVEREISQTWSDHP